MLHDGWVGIRREDLVSSGCEVDNFSNFSDGQGKEGPLLDRHCSVLDYSSFSVPLQDSLTMLSKVVVQKATVKR